MKHVKMWHETDCKAVWIKRIKIFNRSILSKNMSTKFRAESKKGSQFIMKYIVDGKLILDQVT